jgi:transposase
MKREPAYAPWRTRARRALVFSRPGELDGDRLPGSCVVCGMTMGRSEVHDDLFRSVHELCSASVGERSVFRLLAEQGHLLFPDEMFADLYSTRGRRSIAPRVMATVMVLQRFEGLSDSEAVDRLQFDLRYKWACGLAYDAKSFDSTLLVDMRARLRNSEAPDRIFEAVLDVAKRAKLVGRKRIVDSTALYDAVATQDTVTLVRSAIVGVLRVVNQETATELRQVLKRDDPYDKSGKPSCAWDDEAARAELVDALTRDANALLGAQNRPTKGPPFLVGTRWAASRAQVLVFDPRPTLGAWKSAHWAPTLARARRPGARAPCGEGDGTARNRGGSGPRREGGCVSDRARRRTRSRDLNRRSRGATRSQDVRAWFRWLQGPRSRRRRIGDHHGNGSHRGQRRRRKRG